MLSSSPSEPAASVRPSRVRYWVLALLCLATTTAYVDRGCISVMEKLIRVDLDIDKETMGTVLGAFFIVYALFQVPAGWLGHVWGTRRALAFYSILWSAATGFSALATGFVGLFVARIWMGMAEAGVIPCSADALSKWFPSTRRGRASGILASFQGVGAAFGSLLTGLLLADLGWRIIFLLYAAPGILWSIWFFWWFRDRPRDHTSVNAAERELIEEGVTIQSSDEVRGPTPWWEMLTSLPLWGMNAQQFFRAGAFAFYLTWFPTFLQETRGVSPSASGVFATFPHITTLLGGIMGGFVSDWLLVRTGSLWASRQGLGAMAMGVCTLFMLPAYFISDPYFTVAFVAGSAFFSAMAGPCVFVFTIELGGKHVSPVFGVVNMAGNLGAAAFARLVPTLVDATGWNHSLTLVMVLNLLCVGFWLTTASQKPLGAAKEAA